jgi:signal transduction histidine kinase
LKRVEWESFFKAFLLYFFAMGALLAALFKLDDERSLTRLDQTIFHEMERCSYDLNCTHYTIDFAPLDDAKLRKLVHDPDGGLHADFPIPDATRYALRIALAPERYEARVDAIHADTLRRLALALSTAFLLSLLFAWYALRPLRQALRLTEEFVRDVLHDFRTPLSTIRLNAAMLAKSVGARPEIDRIEKGVERILHLQSDLREYLDQVASSAQRIDLASFVRARLEPLIAEHPELAFDLDVSPATLIVDPKPFGRILDNLLNNAVQHNEPGGQVAIRFEPPILVIENTGPGIRHPEKVFKRFYKEGRKAGHGLGMHIVKKLCDMLRLKISVESGPGRLTRVTLDLTPLLSERRTR